MCAGSHLVRADINLTSHLGDIPYHIGQVGLNGPQTHRQGLKITRIVCLVGPGIFGQIAACDLPQNPAHIVNGLPQTAADPVDRLGNHADLVRSP